MRDFRCGIGLKFAAHGTSYSADLVGAVSRTPSSTPILAAMMRLRESNAGLESALSLRHISEDIGRRLWCVGEISVIEYAARIYSLDKLVCSISQTTKASSHRATCTSLCAAAAAPELAELRGFSAESGSSQETPAHAHGAGTELVVLG